MRVTVSYKWLGKQFSQERGFGGSKKMKRIFTEELEDIGIPLTH